MPTDCPWLATPRVFAEPHRSACGIRTLQEIGVRTSEQALKAGYVLLRQAQRNGSSFRPGMWALPADLPRVLSKCGEIAELVASERISKRRPSAQTLARRCRSALPSELRDFFPVARSLGRRLTFFSGPTNSGKTHRALQLLKAAPTGVYLAPLRLLALEVQERLQADGVPASLVTGELVVPVEGAAHTCATVEMLQMSSVVDVAVIDEVQMLDDRERGTAWLQAVLGAPARHVVLVGSPAALGAVRQLAEHTGESLEVVDCQRLSDLVVEDGLLKLGALGPGDAVIAFSRAAVLGLAEELRAKGRRVAVIYGALGPEVRREQARLFREGEAEILVATDAIGMGLNLPISRVVFSTHTKWDGQEEVGLGCALVHQIAGRAGRYGLSESGRVGALSRETLNFVRKQLQQAPKASFDQIRMGLSLPVAQVLQEQAQLPTLSKILDFFARNIVVNDWATTTVSDAERKMALALDARALSLEQKVSLLHAPADFKGCSFGLLEAMLRCIELERVESLHGQFLPVENLDLEQLEIRAKELSLYCWMHYRHVRSFPRIEAARALLEEIARLMVKRLRKASGRRCRECRAGLPWNHAFAICNRCYTSRDRYAGWY